jgi:hypothetical protein
MFLLDRQLRDIVQALPYLTDDRKANLTKAEHLDQWTDDSDVVEALQEFFNSETDYQTFMVIMGKIVQLLAQLVKDSVSRIDRKEMVSDDIRMIARLSDLHDTSHHSSSTFGS